MSDETFMETYGPSLKKLLRASTKYEELSNAVVQQYHMCPGVLKDGKRSYSAADAKAFLTRVGQAGFGVVTRGKTKQLHFKRVDWEQLGAEQRDFLTGSGIAVNWQENN